MPYGGGFKTLLCTRLSSNPASSFNDSGCEIRFENAAIDDVESSAAVATVGLERKWPPVKMADPPARKDLRGSASAVESNACTADARDSDRANMDVSESFIMKGKGRTEIGMKSQNATRSLCVIANASFNGNGEI